MTDTDTQSKGDLAIEFKKLLGDYIDEFLAPVYSESNPLLGIFIKKGKSALFKRYSSPHDLISECYNNLYKHKQLIDDKDTNFFLNQKIKIFPKVPDNFSESFRQMWIEGHENELPEDEKEMSWGWFSQFLEVLEDWVEAEDDESSDED